MTVLDPNMVSNVCTIMQLSGCACTAQSKCCQERMTPTWLVIVHLDAILSSCLHHTIKVLPGQNDPNMVTKLYTMMQLSGRVCTTQSKCCQDRMTPTWRVIVHLNAILSPCLHHTIKVLPGQNAPPTDTKPDKSVAVSRIHQKEMILNCQIEEWYISSEHADWPIMVCHKNLSGMFILVQCAINSPSGQYGHSWANYKIQVIVSLLCDIHVARHDSITLYWLWFHYTMTVTIHMWQVMSSPQQHRWWFHCSMTSMWWVTGSPQPQGGDFTYLSITSMRWITSLPNPQAMISLQHNIHLVCHKFTIPSRLWFHRSIPSTW